MFKKVSFLLLGGLLLTSAHCNNIDSSNTPKESVKNPISKNEFIKKEILPGQAKEETVREKVDRSLNLMKESSKLIKENNDLLKELKTKIEENAKKIADLEDRVEKVEKGKVDKKVAKKVKKKRRLRKKLISQQKVLVRRYCRDEYYVPARTFTPGNYKIYVGAFREYNNAVARQSGVRNLGLPVTIRKNTKTVKTVPTKVKQQYNVQPYEQNSADDFADASYFNNGEKAYVETVPEYEYKYIETVPSTLYRVVTTRNLSYNDAVRWTNYLLSKGFEAYFSRR